MKAFLFWYINPENLLRVVLILTNNYCQKNIALLKNILLAIILTRR